MYTERHVFLITDGNILEYHCVYFLLKEVHGAHSLQMAVKFL
jgi:hypothetical protein